MSNTKIERDHHRLETVSLDELLGSEWRGQLGKELSELAEARAASATAAKKTFM